MQVVSGRIAGGTDITDDFALFHFLPYGHADRGTVGIQGVKSIVMVYLDIVSIPPQVSMALAMVTVPSAAVRIGVPPGAPISVPLW